MNEETVNEETAISNGCIATTLEIDLVKTHKSQFSTLAPSNQLAISIFDISCGHPWKESQAQ